SEDRRGRSDLLSMFVPDDAAGIGLAKAPRDRRRDAGGARVVAVDDDRFQRHRLAEFLPHRRLVVARLPGKSITVEAPLDRRHPKSPFAMSASNERHAPKRGRQSSRLGAGWTNDGL